MNTDKLCVYIFQHFANYSYRKLITYIFYSGITYHFFNCLIYSINLLAIAMSNDIISSLIGCLNAATDD